MLKSLSLSTNRGIFLYDYKHCQKHKVIPKTKAYNFSCIIDLTTEKQCLHEKKVIKQNNKLQLPI